MKFFQQLFVNSFVNNAFVNKFNQTIMNILVNLLKNPRVVFYLFLLAFALLFSKLVALISVLFIILSDMQNSLLYDTLSSWFNTIKYFTNSTKAKESVLQTYEESKKEHMEGSLTFSSNINELKDMLNENE